jgi:hypothetical protein
MSESLLNTPILWVNTYLQEKFALGGSGVQSAVLGQDGADAITSDATATGIGVPFFPSMPTSIDAITEQWVTIDDQRYPTSGLFATWDRMFRMRRGPFPHIKAEQALYYFYAVNNNSIPLMIQTQEKVYRLLDRGDESAEEVNAWAAQKGAIDLDGQSVECRFKFHDFKVYQLEEVRDIIDFGTARTYAGNKIIIDYTYHQIGSDGNVL